MFAESRSVLRSTKITSSLEPTMLSEGGYSTINQHVKRAPLINFAEYSSDEDDQTRIDKKLLDYEMAMAAAVIQRAVRVWLAKRCLAQKRVAAIIIQKYWRGYRARRYYFYVYEAKVQKANIRLYKVSATKIQAAFRGWSSRKRILDLIALNRMRTHALIELLSCIAVNFHHMLISGSIPGVYSLRDSSCFEKVEQFLATLNMRFYNECAERNFKRDRMWLRDSRWYFENSKLYTALPYSGPNDFGNCAIALPDTKEYFNYTSHIRQLVEKHEIAGEMSKEKEMMAKAKLVEDLRKDMELRAVKIRNRNNFCGEVIDSMKRWKIWDNENFEISKDIFNTPENVERFIDDIEPVLRAFQYNCYCVEKNQPLGEACK